MSQYSHGGDIWKYQGGIRKNFIDFSANINPLGLPMGTKNLISKNMDFLVDYPQAYCETLKSKLAKMYGIKENNILIGNGSIELIYRILEALSPRRISLALPTFSEYERAAHAHGAHCMFVNRDEKKSFAIDIPKLLSIASRVDLIFLCNPNNPTGSTLSKGDILLLLKACRRNKTILVLDEAFIDFHANGDIISLLHEAARTSSLIVLRSLTKIYALAGLRIGYLAASEKLVKRISIFQPPWSVNTLAQVVGEHVIRDTKYKKRTKNLIRKERDYLIKKLQQHKGLTVFPSDVNFLLCKIDKSLSVDAKELKERLLVWGILIRDCQNFRGLNKRFFRIAVKSHQHNVSLINAIEKEMN